VGFKKSKCHKTSIDLSHLPTATYFVLVTTEKTKISLKLLKEEQLNFLNKILKRQTCVLRILIFHTMFIFN